MPSDKEFARVSNSVRQTASSRRNAPHHFARRRNVISPFKLNATLGRDYNADLDDTLRTKKALQKIGLFETPSYGMTEFPDEPLFKGIEKFQARHGLKQDGIMKQDGETARRRPSSARS
tara:strand:+ start:9096 stop:9452 length:357 start_codon:yes stop_codon:yes gene_type:complete